MPTMPTRIGGETATLDLLTNGRIMTGGAVGVKMVPPGSSIPLDRYATTSTTNPVRYAPSGKFSSTG